MRKRRLSYAWVSSSGFSGLELAQRMRRIRPDFPVVLYTGYLDGPSTEQAKAAGIGGSVIIKR